MFDHVTIRVADAAQTERFYSLVLGTLGMEPTAPGEWEDFSFASAAAERPVTRGLHIGFAAPSREHVDEFWRAGVNAGFRENGAPGPRDYTPSYYGAFLVDPDGNSVEAVHRDGVRTDGNVDHLWLRTPDVRAARDFYACVTPHAPVKLFRDTPDRVTFVRAGRGGGTFTFVTGEPTTANVHVAFLALDRTAVNGFHAAALACGYEDEGAPGERPEYHAGYYGAFVRDPDGHVIESVHHQRP